MKVGGSAAGGLSVSVGRAESSLFDDALAECDADLEDILFCSTWLMGMSLS